MGEVCVKDSILCSISFDKMQHPYLSSLGASYGRFGVSLPSITHNLQHVYPVADRIVVLSHGSKIGDYRRRDTSVDKLTALIVQG